MKTIRIATRRSALALWQAEYVRDRLRAAHPDLAVELVPLTTRGDQVLDTPLAAVGGKGLFVKELEEALMDGRADIAVHSMKDVTVELPEGLGIAVVCEREDPSDAFVSNTYAMLRDLPIGARVGTSSLRRQCQLRHRYPGLQVESLRGNVQTRLKRLDEGAFDAIVLASAGLRRLGLADRIRHPLDMALSLPAAGQGAVGIECRTGDRDVLARIAPLDDPATHTCVRAERAMNAALQGGCQVPIGAHATLEGEGLMLDGLVGSVDGRVVLRELREGFAGDPEALGRALAEDLLARGAGELLRALHEQG